MRRFSRFCAGKNISRLQYPFHYKPPFNPKGLALSRLAHNTCVFAMVDLVRFVVFLSLPDGIQYVFIACVWPRSIVFHNVRDNTAHDCVHDHSNNVCTVIMCMCDKCGQFSFPANLVFGESMSTCALSLLYFQNSTNRL
jgi:hypothetical protein